MDGVRRSAGAGSGAESRIAGDSAGNDQAARADGFRRGGRAGWWFVDDGAGTASQKVQCLLRRDCKPLFDRWVGMVAQHGFASGDFVFHVARLHPAQDGRFVAAEAEVEGVALHSGEGEVDGVGVAVRRKAVDHGAAGVP